LVFLLRYFNQDTARKAQPEPLTATKISKANMLGQFSAPSAAPSAPDDWSRAEEDLLLQLIRLALVGDEDSLTQASRDRAARAWRDIASSMTSATHEHGFRRQYTRDVVMERYINHILPRLVALRAAVNDLSYLEVTSGNQSTYIELVEAGLAGSVLYNEVWPAKGIVELAEYMEAYPEEFPAENNPTEADVPSTDFYQLLKEYLEEDKHPPEG
jgi:hypothetical protein